MNDGSFTSKRACREAVIYDWTPIGTTFLGERISKAMTGKGISQLSRQIKRTPALVRAWRNGLALPLATDLADISRVTGRPVGFFYWGYVTDATKAPCAEFREFSHAAIGEAVKTCGSSSARIAGEAGLSVAGLEAMIAGQATPTVEDLAKISDATLKPIDFFYRPPAVHGRALFRRKQSQKRAELIIRGELASRRMSISACARAAGVPRSHIQAVIKGQEHGYGAEKFLASLCHVSMEKLFGTAAHRWRKSRTAGASPSAARRGRKTATSDAGLPAVATVKPSTRRRA